MASVNKVILIGNLGANPELKYLPSGQAVCEMRIATTDTWMDKQNQKQERTEWHRIVVWGKTAENCAQYLAKGRPVYVEGRLQTRSWDDKATGEKRYMTEVVADRVQFLGGGQGQGQGHPGPGQGMPAGAEGGRASSGGGHAPRSGGDGGGPANDPPREAPQPDFGGGGGDDEIPF